jgi:hypothetical protein
MRSAWRTRRDPRRAGYIKLWKNGVLRVSYSGHTDRSVVATVNFGAHLFVLDPEELGSSTVVTVVIQ